MASVTIDDKEYDLDQISDKAKNLLNSVQFAQSEIQRIQSQLALIKTAASVYTSQLKEELET
tara:strand:- start:84 stop:269 length:186 start_codon:yes stop_codon:yes gene_type:complete